MSRRRGRRRHRRARAVTFPSFVPSDSQADKKDGRQRYLKVAVMLLFAVTSVAAVTTSITVPSSYNTDVNATNVNVTDGNATNDPSHQSWEDFPAGAADPEGFSGSGQSGWDSVRAKRDFAEDDSPDHRVPDAMRSSDAPPLFDPKSTTPPTGDMKNAKVPEQTETLESEGWKSFRVQEFPTANDHTQVPTGEPQLGGEEWDVYENWGFTAEDNHRSTVRVRRPVSNIPDDSSPETYDSPAANMTQLELKPNSSLERKASGDIDKTGTTSMDNVRMVNTTDLNLYLDAVLTDSMKSRERKHRVIKRIKKARAIVLAVVGVLIAGVGAYTFLT
ncbi:uncharacterized protein LOC118422632 isoform X2 [Branchiostoma floridae]|uniref:Uncharacterized protein LOC118422632 isoform X2 n=1 Tax=Branchiostoma floridae TaxID=7739 RepID=A0A9J7N0Y2_BRAFL|nr:uncharacterized protein LOC118422632 isoform X2 [Branchiostoma floridae]